MKPYCLFTYEERLVSLALLFAHGSLTMLQEDLKKQGDGLPPMRREQFRLISEAIECFGIEQILLNADAICIMEENPDIAARGKVDDMGLDIATKIAQHIIDNDELPTVDVLKHA